MAYDYKQRKDVIYNIINSSTEVADKTSISDIESETNGSLTFNNGIKGWVVSIFVDLVNSTELFKGKNDKTIAKVIRTFSSETIQILNDTQMYKRIGVRGDCVFAIFASPNKENVAEAYNMAVEINTLKKMINKVLRQNNMPQIDYGIGIGLSKDLVIKVGKKGVINDLVFIGKAVVNASNLSNIASRNGIGSIAIDPSVYTNIVEQETKNYKDFPTWFESEYEKDSRGYDTTEVEFYHGNVIKTKFDKWIDDGMPDQ
ncbi:MAG: adenylate cyclase [Bacilli bacterium]|jgi:class 3 adenylate cyclase|nr:adenylate cyclase [Bacilli bacterium]